MIYIYRAIKDIGTNNGIVIANDNAITKVVL